MAKFSMQPRSIPMQLGDAEILTMDDSVEDEHWQFVLNHPAFLTDLHSLREDLVMGEIDPADDATARFELSLKNEERTRDALTDPGLSDYPVLTFSQKWGIPPSAVLGLAAMPVEKVSELRPEAITELRREAHGIIVSENDAEFVIRIPRPFTNAKRERLREWVKDAPDDGPLEKAWARVGKKESLSPALVEGIPWFKRWNTGDIEPVKIWRDLTAPSAGYSAKTLSERSVYDRILGIWNRMRELSPDGIRSDKPSQRRG